MIITRRLDMNLHHGAGFSPETGDTNKASKEQVAKIYIPFTQNNILPANHGMMTTRIILITLLATLVSCSNNPATVKSQPSIHTTIDAVHSSWGFVTLNGGNIQGLVPGSTLEVIRSGETVAKLTVSTVEKNRAVADIVRGSMKPNARLRSGDNVRAATPKPIKTN